MADEKSDQGQGKSEETPTPKNEEGGAEAVPYPRPTMQVVKGTKGKSKKGGGFRKES